ncbi:MAG: hypothetical protein ABIG68_03620 [Acidobacteriota bacterium]
MTRRGIAYYVTAHGYGHGVRSCDIIRALNRLRPDLPVVIVSALPQSFYTNRLPSKTNRYRPGAFDVGMVQVDSIRVDVPATLARLRELYAGRDSMIRREREFLAAEGIAAVVADIPAIPIEAAAQAGVPALAVGNFGWDWIYEAYAPQDPGWQAISGSFADGYARANLLLRLPFSEPMLAFSRIEDIPLVASPGRDRRAEIADVTGADPGCRWVLLSFTTLDWDNRAIDRVCRIDGHEFFTVLPLSWERRNIHAVDRNRFPFSDVAATADAIISKPGFGIVSECVANRKPLIYAERTDFLEYPILERAIRRYLRHVHIPAERLYRGELEQALCAVRHQPEPVEQMPLGGDIVAARRILEII